MPMMKMLLQAVAIVALAPLLAPAFYVTLKFVATWLSAWVGIPGGIFAPSLSIGAGVGHNVAVFMGHDIAPALIAMGMAAFLAAVTQAPITAFIIVMEMVDGRSMVLSLMASAMLAAFLSYLSANWPLVAEKSRKGRMNNAPITRPAMAGGNQATCNW